MDINKLLPGLIATGIAAFIGYGFMMWNDVSQLKLRMDYVEKRLEECITQDKLENAKLQLSQQMTVHCK